MPTFIPLNRVDEKCEFDVEVFSLNQSEQYTVEAVGISSAITRATDQFKLTHTEGVTGVQCHAHNADLNGPIYK